MQLPDLLSVADQQAAQFWHLADKADEVADWISANPKAPVEILHGYFTTFGSASRRFASTLEEIDRKNKAPVTSTGQI